MPDGQSFEFGEFGKIPDTDASDRLAVLVTDKMGGGKIVAVELLFKRASLFAHIDCATDGDDASHLVHRSNNRHGYRILGIRCDCRTVISVIAHLLTRRKQTVVTRA